jgi:hypothetical protein
MGLLCYLGGFLVAVLSQGGQIGFGNMIRESEIKKRLNGAIDRLALPLERERVARYTVDRLVPEVKKLIQEEIRAAK